MEAAEGQCLTHGGDFQSNADTTATVEYPGSMSNEGRRLVAVLGLALALTSSVIPAAGSAEPKTTRLSYAEAVDCAGVLRARSELTGLTPSRQNDYVHDAMQFGPWLFSLIPREKSEVWTNDVEVARHHWASIAAGSPDGRTAVQARAEQCLRLH